MVERVIQTLKKGLKKGLMKNYYESKKDWSQLLDDYIYCYNRIPNALGISPHCMRFKENATFD
jgi:hypothetical protein